MCTDNSPKLDHTRKHFKSAIAHFFTDNSDFKLFQGRVPSNDECVVARNSFLPVDCTEITFYVYIIYKYKL